MTDAAFDLGDSAPAEQSAPRGWLRFIRASSGAAVVIRILLGLVLLAAAVLKGHLLATDPFAPTGVPGPRWLAVVFVELEFFLAVWLLSGFFAPAARRVAIVAFIGFAGVSVYRAVAGEASCGCFGRSEVSPWITLAFDLAAIVALALVSREISHATNFARNWRRIAVCLVPVVVVGMIGAIRMVHPVGLPSGSPGLICEESSFDFGTLRAPEANQQHQFHLQNTSNHPIRITGTSSTCGCTVATIPQSVVPAGTSLDIPVQVNWASRQGRRIEEVRLSTDDPSTPEVILGVTGIVQRVASLFPTSIHFGRVKPHSTTSRIVQLYPAPGTSVHVIGVTTSSSLVSIARMDDDSKADTSLPLIGPTGTFRVTFHASSDPGWQTAKATFHMDQSAAADQILEVTADVITPFKVTPRALYFDGAGANQKILTISIDEDSEGAVMPTVSFEKTLERKTFTIRPTISHGTSPKRKGRWSFKVILNARNLKPGLHRAVLRVEFGSDHVDVPLVAVSTSGK